VGDSTIRLQLNLNELFPCHIQRFLLGAIQELARIFNQNQFLDGSMYLVENIEGIYHLVPIEERII